VCEGGEVIRAVQDFVILIPDAIERVTKAGIIMPNEVAEDAALRKPVTGKVVAMGPLCKQNQAKVGDHIMADSRGQVFEYEGVTYQRVYERDVLARLD
jgi:co-chaperonin GroES (HSP10)